MLTGNEFQTLGAENQKARDPNVTLWWGTESWWELDERRDLVGSWRCKRSERYGGWPVCKALRSRWHSILKWQEWDKHTGKSLAILPTMSSRYWGTFLYCCVLPLGIGPKKYGLLRANSRNAFQPYVGLLITLAHTDRQTGSDIQPDKWTYSDTGRHRDMQTNMKHTVAMTQHHTD